MKRVSYVVIAGLLAASCGSGGDPAANSTVPPASSTTTTTPAVTGTWFDGLAAGVCFDDIPDGSGGFDFSVPAATVPCDTPHDNEIVARVRLGEGAFPADVATTAADLCADEFTEFFATPIENTAMTAFNVWPDETDWTAGVRDVICAVYAPEATIGTAASAGLSAPGETIAMLAIVESTQTLWIVDAGTREVISDDAATGIFPTGVPSWAPDGSAIAITAILSETDHDVYVLDAGGGAPEAVVESDLLDENGAIAPVGASIAFVSNIGGGEFDIFVLDLESGTTTQLTDSPERDVDPQWSPDGSRIAFRKRVDGNSDVYVMNADGSDVRRLTTDPGFDGDPRWSPDGTELLFTSDRARGYDIWIMNADGSDQRQVTTHPADEEYPTWSSDGAFIAFQTNRHGVDQVWIMRADGTGQSMLIGTTPTAFPRFAPVQLG